MRVVFNRPSKISVLQELDSLGYPVSYRNVPFSEDSFPSAFETQYVELWDKFIKTQTAKDLFNQGHDVLVGNLNVTLGFLSYMLLFVSKPTDVDYNLTRVSNLNIVNSIQDIKAKLPRWLKSRRITENFIPTDIDIQVKDTYNDFISVFNPISASVFITYSPKKRRKLQKTDFGVKSVENSLDPILYSIRQYLFKGNVPKQLKGQTKILGGNRKKTKYPELSLVKKRQVSMWHLMDAVGNMNIFAHRSGENTFTIKFTLDIPAIYYCGSKPKHQVMQEIKTVIQNTLKLR